MTLICNPEIHKNSSKDKKDNIKRFAEDSSFLMMKDFAVGG